MKTMKTMKKLLIILLGIISYSSFSQTTLTVDVSDVYSIEVSGDPTIVMNTADHFENGNSTEMNGHVTLTSTSAYTLTVKADATNFNSVEGNTVGVSSVEVSTPGGVGDIALSETSQDLAISASGEIGKVYDITYSISSDNAVNFLGLGEDTLTTIITYEIIPD